MNSLLAPILLLLIALTPSALAQGDEGPLPSIVYEGLEFPTLPFDSNFVEVAPEGLPGAQLHYLEAGDPANGTMLLIHGQPTWSYLWRKIIPHLEPHAHVIAIDLVGMGQSGKPDIDYRFTEHAAYLESFIGALELTDLTLVIHDWGSALGFDYAARNPENVRGIAFLEALVAPVSSFEEMETLTPDFAEALKVFRDPDAGKEVLINQNIFVEQVLPDLMLRNLSEEELNAYRAPYPTPAERLPVWRWPNEIPIAGEPADTFERVAAYSQWLFSTDLPLLQLYGTPGMIGTAEFAAMLDESLQNVTTVHVGEGLHFLQEDQPDTIGVAIATWYQLLD